MKRVTILGSTGSIGRSTLQVLDLHPAYYQVWALGAARQHPLLLQQCLQFNPRYAVMDDADAAAALRTALREAGSSTEVLAGEAAMAEVAAAPETDIVMAAIVGAAGLASTLAAARAGKRVLLANKESMVVAGHLLNAAVRAGGAELLPIDSEHSAILQSLPADRARWALDVRDITLTASGGPFRRRDPAELEQVTPEQACAHPKWDMGRKISVDSATMMNKGLEVIEAHHLFGVPAAQIRVLIHPQSIVHSMVGYHDGSVLAQLGAPDMRTPIACGLAWPQRIASGSPWLDLASSGPLEFEHPDPQRFPALQLAYDALALPQGACAVLNAANEVAVSAFLQRRIRFTDITRINAEMLEDCTDAPATDLDALLDLDQRTRQLAAALVAQLQD